MRENDEPRPSEGRGELTSQQKPSPWGFWPTVGFSCIIAIVYILIQVIVLAIFALAAIARTQDLDIEQFTNSLQSNGFFLSVTIYATSPFTIGLIILFAKIRRPPRLLVEDKSGGAAGKTITIKEYLCLHRVGWKELFKWSLIVLLFAGFFDTLTFLLDRPIVPKFMLDTYTTAYFVPSLWLAFIIIAPVVEELFFRGFLFKGIEHSKLGPAGAVVITSLLWSIMHVQYDVYSIISLFTGGLLLGLARAKSNSIYTPIVMHILQNIIATIETIIYIRMMSNAA